MRAFIRKALETKVRWQNNAAMARAARVAWLI
jgi:hypothetical protein